MCLLPPFSARLCYSTEQKKGILAEIARIEGLEAFSVQAVTIGPLAMGGNGGSYKKRKILFSISFSFLYYFSFTLMASFLVVA